MTGRAPLTGRAGRDRGSATVWALTAAALVLMLAYAGLLLAAVAQARQRAAAAADLAALAAASSVRDPCGAAARSAAANGARLLTCAPSAGDVLVRAAAPLPGALAAFGARWVAVSARAGPG